MFIRLRATHSVSLWVNLCHWYRHLGALPYMPLKLLQLQQLPTQDNLDDAASKTCGAKETGEQGRNERQHSASPYFVSFNEGWENCSDFSSWGLGCDVTPSPLISHIFFQAGMSQRTMWLMQPDTPCHRARPASWETVRKKEERKRKRKKASEKKSNWWRTHGQGVIFVFRKGCVACRSQKSTAQKKENWSRTNQWANRFSGGLDRPSRVEKGTKQVRNASFHVNLSETLCLSTEGRFASL